MVSLLVKGFILHFLDSSSDEEEEEDYNNLRTLNSTLQLKSHDDVRKVLDILGISDSISLDHLAVNKMFF